MEHDASYKDLLSHPEMMADLLTGFVPEACPAGARLSFRGEDSATASARSRPSR